jgi:hypothetical protein
MKTFEQTSSQVAWAAGDIVIGTDLLAARAGGADQPGGHGD